MPELMDGTYISDQEDQEGYLGYDATHCEHGTFVGDAFGPDYICGKCEMDEHRWGPVEHARFTGNPHRKCLDCNRITLDLEDE